MEFFSNFSLGFSKDIPGETFYLKEFFDDTQKKLMEEFIGKILGELLWEFHNECMGKFHTDLLE